MGKSRCEYLGRGQIGGSFENQADKYKQCGSQKEVVMGFEQRNDMKCFKKDYQSEDGAS